MFTKVKIHRTAIVEEGAQLEEGVEIGPFCYVGPKVKIGAGTRLISHVTILGKTTLGRNNVIFPQATIGGDPQDLKYAGEETEVIVGDDNIIRECVTINRGTTHGFGRTVVGNKCFFMACSHVAHDCLVGNNVIMANCALLAGHVRVEDNAYLSGQVVVHQFATIGRHALISGATRVPRDAPPFMITQGNGPEVVTVNSTGLKRFGFEPDVINALKDAHRLIWASGLPLPDAIECIKKQHNGHYKEVQYLIEFLLNSTRGKNGRALEALRTRHAEHCRTEEE